MPAPLTVALDDDRMLACCQWGPTDGEPLFLLHGTPGSRFLRHPDEVYQRAAARVITYDRPGYGGSTRLPGRQVSHAAADLVSIADQLGLDQFGVCGISGGGPHALAVATCHPDRVRRCATVVSLAPYGVPRLDFFAGMSAADREEWTWTQQGDQAVAEHVVPGLMSWLDTLDTEQPPDGMTEWVRRMLVQTFREAFAPGAQVVTVPGGHLGPRDREEELLIAWLSSRVGL